MLKNTIIVGLILIMFSTIASNAQKTVLKTKNDTLSYCIGFQIGSSLKKDSLMLNLDVMNQAMTTIMKGDNVILTQEAMTAFMTNFQKEMMEKKNLERKAIAEKNKAVGEKFLAENKTKTGVTTTPSGLQYKIIKSGTGATPSSTDKVSVHYTGTLIDGTEFDSSIKRGKPAEFPVTGVIKGWTEALQLMKEGDKWTLYVPASLAYGENGMGQNIPGNATLIFDVELLKVLPKDATSPSSPSIKPGQPGSIKKN